MIFQFEYEHREQGHTQLLDLVDGMRAGQDAFIVYYAQWCPDCAAVPGILQGLENAGVGTVIMCNIGVESKLWKSGEHYYKQPPLSLRGIPTVVRWGAEGEVERMERGLMDGTMMRQGAYLLLDLRHRHQLLRNVGQEMPKRESLLLGKRVCFLRR